MCSELRHSTSRLNWNAIPTIWSHNNPPVDSMLPHRKPPKERQPSLETNKQKSETPIEQISVEKIVEVGRDSRSRSRSRDSQLKNSRP